MFNYQRFFPKGIWPSKSYPQIFYHSVCHFPCVEPIQWRYPLVIKQIKRGNEQFPKCIGDLTMRPSIHKGFPTQPCLITRGYPILDWPVTDAVMLANSKQFWNMGVSINANIELVYFMETPNLKWIKIGVPPCQETSIWRDMTGLPTSHAVIWRTALLA